MSQLRTARNNRAPSARLTAYCLVMLATASVALGTARSTRERRPTGGVHGDSGTTATPYVFGARYCANCHGKTQAEPGACRMVEATIWQNSDPHRGALDWAPDSGGAPATPAGKRAAEIGARLGIRDVASSQRCVGCHSVRVANPAFQQAFTPTTEGVTCVACHGAYDPWVTEHQVINKEPWKSLTREQKWLQYGMVDLWDPITRARTCSSCHLGEANPDSGKFLPHEVYAAGHPPLTSIEVATFCEQLPKHWLEARCKLKERRPVSGHESARMEQTELVVATALVASQRALDLLESHPLATTNGWPDFARFDCVACHHELKSEGGLQIGATGRPIAPRWPSALTPIVLASALPARWEGRGTDFETRARAIASALKDRPFGDSATLETTASALSEWLEGPIADLRAASRASQPNGIIDERATLSMLRRLVDAGARGTEDFDSDRQLAWATRTLWHEYEARVREIPDDPRAAEAVAAAPEINKAMRDLVALLALDLRPGFSGFPDCPPSHPIGADVPRAPEALVGARLDARLATAASYDGNATRRAFAALRDALPPP